MQIGTCAWGIEGAVYGRISLSQLCKIAKKCGFDFLEAPFYSHQKLFNPQQSFIIPIKSFSIINSRRISLISSDSEIKNFTKKTISNMIDASLSVGAKSVSLSPGKICLESNLDSSIATIVENIESMYKLANNKGISLLFENVPGHILEKRTSVRKLLSFFPNLQLCFDIANALIDPPINAWIEEFGDNIKKIHFSDGRINKQGYFEATQIGLGDVKFNECKSFMYNIYKLIDIFVEIPPKLPNNKLQIDNLFNTRKTVNCILESLNCM